MNRRLLTLVSCLLACAACAEGTADGVGIEAGRAAAPASESRALDDPAVRLARLPESRVGDSAALDGTLRVEEGCLYVETPGGERFLLAFTLPEARWDDERRTLVAPVSPGGLPSNVAPGERLIAAGSEATGSLEGTWLEPPAPGCDPRRIWIAHGVTSLAVIE